MIKFDKKTAASLLIFALVALAVLYILFPLGVARYFTDRSLLMHLIREHHAHAAFIFIGLQVLQVIAAPLPGEVTGLVGGIVFGAAKGTLYSLIGLTLGSWCAFMIARIAGRPLVEKIVKPETIKRYDYVMEHRGRFLAFLMFLIPGFPKDILCYILGLGHMAQRDFLIISTTGRLLGTALLTIEGEFLRDERYAAFFTILGISIVIILLIIINRSGIERRLRLMRASERLKARAERKRRKEADH